MITLSISLFIVSLVTATISGAIGMGGGVLLFSFMTFVMPVSALVPIHGLVQMQSNCLRVFFLRKFIRKDIFTFFVAGAIPGIFIAAYFLRQISTNQIPLLLILVLILYSVFKPKKLPPLMLRPVHFFVVGIVAGFLGILIGAVGPFLASFFVRDDFSKQEIVANKSAMQAFIHISKLPVFFYLGFDYLEYIVPLVVMMVAGTIGTKIGVGLIDKIDRTLFTKLYKAALLIAAARISYKLITSLGLNFNITP